MNDQLQTYYDGWRNKIAHRYAESTLYQYCQWLRHFLNWCEAHSIDPLHANFRVINSFVEEKEIEASANTIRHYINAIENFYNYLVWNLELLPTNPVEHYRKVEPLKSNNHRAFPKAALADVRQIVFESRDITTRTIVAVMLECGLRNKEVIRIRENHVNLTNQLKTITVEQNRGARSKQEPIIIFPNTIFIRWGRGRKGEKHRHVILVGPVRQILRKYLAWRKMQNPITSRLFINQHGRHLSNHGLSLKILMACEELDIRSGDSKGYTRTNHAGVSERIGENGIYPRQLRPLFRSEMSMRKMDEKVIDMQTGHSSPHIGRRIYDQRTYEERLEEHLKIGPLLV